MENKYYYQFAYKSKHGTAMCIYAIKEIISFYHEHNSSVFVRFLDASKAFDLFNHWKLFRKLLQKGMPLIFVRLLVFWYTSQELCVRWGNCFSQTFKTSNGVRQGSVLSPILFNIYMDSLSAHLINSGIGCHINNTCTNHLMYADDLCLISPSAKGLQGLVNICESFSHENDLRFNVNKSVCMFIESKAFKLIQIPEVFLNGVALKYVDEVKYLGHYLCKSMKDDYDIQQQSGKFYARANSMIRNFHACSKNVKSVLFNSFCTSIYGCNLWVNF
jgi:hypothetical protein